MPQVGSQGVTPAATTTTTTRGTNVILLSRSDLQPWNGKNVKEINGFIPKNQQTNSFSNTAVPYNPLTYAQPNSTPMATPTPFVALTPTPIRLISPLSMVQSTGTTVTPGVTQVSGVTPTLVARTPVPVQPSTLTPVTPAPVAATPAPAATTPAVAATTPAPVAATTPAPVAATPGVPPASAASAPSQTPGKASIPASTVPTNIAPASPPTTHTMNLKPNSRSRRSSITERFPQITTERLSELVKM